MTGERGRLARATLEFITQQPSADGWHKRFYKAAVDMKEQGYTFDEAASKLKLASPHLELDGTDMQQLNDVYKHRGGALDVRASWPEVEVSKDGTSKPVKTSLANQKHLLVNMLNYSFSYNARRQLVYIRKGEHGKQELISDAAFAVMRTEAREAGLLSVGIDDLVIALAQENSFDPVMDALKPLQWDGVDHIGQLFQTLSIHRAVPNQEKKWYELMLRRWIIGIVTKIYRPGSENNVLVFQGRQAAGKSRWLKRFAILWPEGYGEGHVSPDDKDHELRHLDNFMWHVAEFDSTTSRREVGALKDYFTKDTVNVRRPFAKNPVVGQSICSFCASVNSHEFLHDGTGNRRYLVIPVESVDADHTVDMLQVFAQAKAAVEAGERQWFSREEIATINTLNSAFMSKEDYVEAIEANVRPGEAAMTLGSILDALGFSQLVRTKVVRSNIRTALETSGVQMVRRANGTYFMVDPQSVRVKKVLSLPTRV
jgi:hypothetical protein